MIAFLLLGGLVLSTVREAANVRYQTTRVLYPAGELVSEVQLANTDMERGVWGYAISEDPAFLTPYVAGRAQAQQATGQLYDLLAKGSPELLPLLNQVADGWQEWVDTAATPLIAQVQGGQASAAREAIALGSGRRSASHVRADLTLLDQALDARVAESVDQLAAINRRLSTALVATTLALLVITAGATVATVRWVIWPLGDLGEQMRRIARDNDTTSPLRPGGPPEIADLGRDSELLRQHLVRQIDTAFEATEGLAQEGPAVAALSGLLRGPTTPRVPDYGVGVASLAAQGALSGDWWDIITLTDAEGQRRSAIEVCDISGHNAAAGVVAARFKGALHVGLRNGVAPAAAVAQAAAIFAMTPEKFASYVLVALDVDTLTYLNAGHNPPLLIRRSGAVERLAGTGPLVTSMPGGSWASATTSMAAGDVLVLYTDGLAEARDSEGEEVGEAQVITWCRALCAESSTDGARARSGYIAHGLLDRARERTVDLRHDDVTVIVAVRQ